MLKQLFLVLAVAGCFVSANPTSAVNCGNGKISDAAVSRNYNEGLRLLQAGATVSSNSGRQYPRRYGDNDGLNLSGQCGSQLYEFPLIKGNSPFGHLDNAGNDRVIFSQANGYCASITHTGASTANGFVLCKNVRSEDDVDSS
ncbi:hypothetical protein CERSUDRAFT_97763 [Gelatoporia subvermispora B]|uniref:Uncharacterized protein n=1 Tax=Ceriporiopsis subvermispora (strain B) TaxID=914234 RepID=M2QQR2_CERS8|nr:hypothetical protein CERSUDRAFT_97763 [Gelatoporia subvermispora B]